MLAPSGCKDENIRQVEFVAICTFLTCLFAALR